MSVALAGNWAYRLVQYFIWFRDGIFLYTFGWPLRIHWHPSSIYFLVIVVRGRARLWELERD